MGQIHIWIKRPYIIVCVLIGVIGTLLLSFTLFGHGHLHQTEEIDKQIPAVSVWYGLGAGSLALSIIGVYGVRKEKKWALILFSVCMIVAVLFLLLICIGVSVLKEKVKQHFSDEYQTFIPLSNATETEIKQLDLLQHDLRCCGLINGYQDWGEKIPVSCVCSVDERNFECVDPGENTVFVFLNNTSEKDDENEELKMAHRLVYDQPCFPLLIADMNFMMNWVLGILLSITVLWGSGAALAIVILCQLRRRVNVPPVMYTTQASKYVELTDQA
ncbi:hypothetical protein UPYG_G00248950 [Umbra pygmaea]|uniref:Tetraspanin n=1 Tax=Umbra pygmaea TaxID=75934 RepID=A0ABD0WBW6_UMBPY